MDKLIKENINDVFLSYNDMIQDNESESSEESYKDVNNFLQQSSDSHSTCSYESENPYIFNNNSEDERTAPIISYVSQNYICKKERKYKKSYTASYINNMNSIDNFPFKSYGHVPSISDKIKELSNFQWKPLGKNVPKISLINLSHKKAWDIGKEGCNGILIKNLFESYKKTKLNYMVLDGTNLDKFLTVYSRTYQETINGVNPSVLKIFSFFDLEEGYFLYDVKSIHLFKKGKKKNKERSIILKDLNDSFYNAILICMNEIIKYLKICDFKNNLKSKIKSAKNDNNTSSGTSITEVDEKTYFVKSVKNEKNLYNNNMKNVITTNKRKTLEKNNILINDIIPNNIVKKNYVSFKDKNYKNKEKIQIAHNVFSNNTEESGYKYLKDIIKKEENELKENDELYNNSYSGYSSHTSVSINQDMLR
ncbi:hypothetical protein PRSY57_1135100 [Plasmodium reichenowi]|uniref:Uncharacterized protein n=1 Tax=Plasmodium reichenowi TaxID=5854 RepID=A0A151LCW9_PLARE|nr:hypothetical protein PRSY57_1135100 [Plasmodium reichenowi]KYN96706.1 hypothetical protein PRSY57_1135100 [Plasmodium reichenowi]